MKSMVMFAPSLRCAARRLLFGTALVTAAASAQAPADVRVALVIGNSAYEGAPLLNPANDARAMSAALKGLGFRVIELRDGGKEQMAASIAQARQLLSDRKGIGMLYYAGHGLQLDWRNYMVPVDARLASAGDVAAQTIDLGNVIDAFKAAGNRMNIVVLDACRDNPFGKTASGKGLAQVDAPPGTFLAYATAPGNVADDGEADGKGNGNGLYTGFLLAELGKPTAKIEDVFKRVRLQVRQSSHGRQVPWESTSLEEDFYFNTGQKVSQPDERARQAAFEMEKAEWERIKGTQDPAPLFAFLQKYPNSDMAEAAQFRLDRIAKPAVQPSLGKGQSANLAYTGERFRLGDEFSVVAKDSLTGVPLQNQRMVVTRVSDDVIEFNNGQGFVTPLGAAIRNNTGNFDPPFGGVPAEFQLGKRWEGWSLRKDGAGRMDRVAHESRIVGRETITVPAGTFDTWVIESVGYITRVDNRAPALTNRMKNWIDPRYGVSIQRTEFVRDVNGRINRTEIRQLAALKAPRD